MKPREKPHHETWLDQIEAHGVNLTTWEEDFVESVRSAVNRGLILSEKQIAIIERIYTEKTP